MVKQIDIKIDVNMEEAKDVFDGCETVEEVMDALVYELDMQAQNTGNGLKIVEARAVDPEAEDKLWVLTVRYSYCDSVRVELFESFEDAKEFFRADFDEEVRIDTEENGHVFGEDYEAYFDEDGLTAYANIGPEGACYNSTVWTLEEAKINKSKGGAQ